MKQTTKTCLPVSRGGCGIEYPTEEFHKEKGGRKPRCKLCQSRWVEMTPEQRAVFKPESTPSVSGYNIVKDGIRGYRVRSKGEELKANLATRKDAEDWIASMTRANGLMKRFFSGILTTRCERRYQDVGLVL